MTFRENALQHDDYSLQVELEHSYRDMQNSQRWVTAALNDLCFLRTGLANPGEIEHCKYVGLEHIDPGTPYLSRWGLSTEVKSAKTYFYSGDILYGKLRPYLDKAVLAPFDGICSTDILVLAPKPAIDPLFLSYLLHSQRFTRFAVQSSHGVNHPRTSWSSLASFEQPIPIIEEQQAIAQALQTVQETIQARGREIELERECKAALMEYLFTYGPVSEGTILRRGRKETGIGLLPESWEVILLGEIIASGPKNGVYKHRSLYGQGTRIVRINDFDNDGNVISGIGGSNSVILSPDEIEEYCLRKNDILINRVNSLSHLGKVALIGDLNEINIFESNMMRFTIKLDRAEPMYVFRYLTSPSIREQIRGKARRAVAQSSINQVDVKSLILPLPPLAEQREIVDTMNICDEKISSLQLEVVLLEELFQALLEELMTGRLSTISLIEKEGHP